MKKSELAAVVKSAVKEQGVELDKNLLAVQLMTSGASLSMVNRELNKALKANGVEIVTNTGSEELKNVRAAVALALSNHTEEVDGKKIEVESMIFVNYKDLREYAEQLEDDFAVSFEGALKIVKAELKEQKLPVPAKVKLGSQKEEILNYFLKNKKKTSLQGLCEHLQNTVFDENDNPLTKEKALHLARMNYTFAYMLYNRVKLSEVN